MLTQSLGPPGELLPLGELRLLLPPGGGVGLSIISMLDLESQDDVDLAILGLELID